MVQRHLVPWIQNPQSLSTSSGGSTGPSRHEPQAAPVTSSKKSEGPYPWFLGLTVILCCLLLTACIVLGVLYDRESKNNHNSEMEALLSNYQNVSSLYQRAAEANAQLQRENINLTQRNTWLVGQNEGLTHNNTQLMDQNGNLTLENTQLRQEIWNLTCANDRLCNKTSNITACNAEIEGENVNMSHAIDLLERQNRNLTELNARLEKENRNLSDANNLLKGKVDRLTEDNAQGHMENQQLLSQNSWLEEENRNLTQRNVWLHQENQNLSDANSLLRDWCKRAEENSTQLQKENQGVLDQNNLLRNQNQILTHQREMLVAEIQDLTNVNARLRMETVKLMAQLQELLQKYASLDQYCPKVNHETQERLCKKCESRWIAFQSKCYFFSTDTKSWNASWNQCKSEGADLLVVNSVEEQKFAFRTSQAVNQGGTRVWIGLTDEQKEGEWHWVDGSLVTDDLQFWHTRTNGANEPDDWKGTNPLGEDCGHLDTIWQELTSWMDGSCDEAYRWICEKSV
ncbi:hypothetical protein MATL_G00013150 [Megalops atlanticus]|uniref:C-type lectin domain-containing protein n=1 Tax=Megalops atlanticus TaxID=7932 RepID=A0A9D3QLJ9_MEGAT|nr:hypothetical protein MATL_G00013150 [Megalops atlanticus]